MNGKYAKKVIALFCMFSNTRDCARQSVRVFWMSLLAAQTIADIFTSQWWTLKAEVNGFCVGCSGWRIIETRTMIFTISMHWTFKSISFFYTKVIFGASINLFTFNAVVWSFEDIFDIWRMNEIHTDHRLLWEERLFLFLFILSRLKWNGSQLLNTDGKMSNKVIKVSI